jgi:hypothetical protein
MAAGAVTGLTPHPIGMPQRTGGARLRLVVSDGRVIHDDRVGAGVRVPSSWPPAVRLTRRGRIVVAVMTTLAVAALALVLASSVDAAPAQIDHAVTVSAGQTLSEVAAVQLPKLPVRDAVAQIQLANSLSSSQVHAGQILLIPAIP